MCDYRIAAAFGHWLRLKSDGGHSLTIRVNYIMQRNQQKTQLYSRGGKRGEKRNGLQQRVSLCLVQAFV